MTKKEYRAYERSVANFFERNNLMNHLSPDWEKDEDGLAIMNVDGELCYKDEPYFSWRSCECCGSNLGGDRYDVVTNDRDTLEIQGPFSVCSDCCYYVEYGTLDDMTMLYMEEE